jgi:hypothetical protein
MKLHQNRVRSIGCQGSFAPPSIDHCVVESMRPEIGHRRPAASPATQQTSSLRQPRRQQKSFPGAPITVLLRQPKVPDGELLNTQSIRDSHDCHCSFGRLQATILANSGAAEHMERPLMWPTADPILALSQALSIEVFSVYR